MGRIGEKLEPAIEDDAAPENGEGAANVEGILLLFAALCDGAGVEEPKSPTRSSVSFFCAAEVGLDGALSSKSMREVGA